MDCQLGQDRVVAARQILTDLAQDLVDDVEIVGQPVGVDAVDLLASATKNLLSGADQDAPVLDEPLQATGC